MRAATLVRSHWRRRCSRQSLSGRTRLSVAPLVNTQCRSSVRNYKAQEEQPSKLLFLPPWATSYLGVCPPALPCSPDLGGWCVRGTTGRSERVVAQELDGGRWVGCPIPHTLLLGAGSASPRCIASGMFHMENNQFSGRLLRDICRFDFMKEVGIQGNKFTGVVSCDAPDWMVLRGQV